ncbi:uncharacterized protein F4822DRAFT_41253 [Hypoxylon trugodes]|uniref:uncharacterized protein n=1 Tax=Hypoxylon trugodes TaxID=326681 RepID=UPI00219AFA9D|nr:uncharacterized protein F4822DRAFT_41253 [Hypoxylon trugodes]KAI1394218.1 hypothetical protein F4822DRAFT_41253 [Hypoxylon trugodes]
MGLSGPRIRRKLQHDPNNTKWSRDETTFGQRILRAQGWEPGKFLGAQNSPHSHLHSAASAAPINVILKDDTLGLGAKPKHKQNAECTGLDVFKDLLGRLNGKSEETIEQERQVRSGIKTNLYVEKKYGLMRFVSGGLLVGDQINELVSTTIKKEETSSLEDTAAIPLKKEKKDKKSKKRKAEDSDSAEILDTIPEKKRKKRSKDEDLPNDVGSGPEADESNSKKKSKKSKRKEIEEDTARSEKRKHKKSKRDAKVDVEDDDAPAVPNENALEKSKSKNDKKEKRKKEKREKKNKQTDTAESSTDAPTPAISATPQESGLSTPTGTGTSTPQAFPTRNYSRSRNIASKRLAIADMQALNQIFMVKPV